MYLQKKIVYTHSLSFVIFLAKRRMKKVISCKLLNDFPVHSFKDNILIYKNK